MIKTVAGSFDSFLQASQASRDLRLAGFLESDINIIANDTARQADPAVAAGSLNGAPHEVQGTTAGVVAGGAGAVAGGLIGGLTDLGIAKSDAEHYAEAVRRGGALVTVRADSTRADEAEATLRRGGAFDIKQRALQWQSEGWRGYDPDAGFRRGNRTRAPAIRGRACTGGRGSGIAARIVRRQFVSWRPSSRSATTTCPRRVLPRRRGFLPASCAWWNPGRRATR